METLKDRKKTMIVGVLKGEYSLPLLLKRSKLPKSNYYYRETSLKKQDKCPGIRKRISALSNGNSGRYGHHRIHAPLSHEGTTISEKVVRRIIVEEEIVARVRSGRSYNSFQGQIPLPVLNAGNRDSHVGKPNEKWLAGIA